MGDFFKRQPQFTLEMFHAFRDERPKEEKWELIDGVPMMMSRPTTAHQRIASSLAVSLQEHLGMIANRWGADAGVWHAEPGFGSHVLRPDVIVIDADIEIGQIYAERFYFVVEVLSNSDRPEQRAGADKPIVLAAKLAYYQRHEHCCGVLIVRQDRIEADLHVREPTGWEFRALRAAADRIVIPDIGDIGALGECYRDTPIAPKSH